MKPVIPTKVLGAAVLRGRVVVKTVQELYSSELDLSTMLMYAKREGLITGGEYADAMDYRGYRGDLSRLEGGDEFVTVEK